MRVEGHAALSSVDCRAVMDEKALLPGDWPWASAASANVVRGQPGANR